MRRGAGPAILSWPLLLALPLIVLLILPIAALLAKAPLAIPHGQALEAVGVSLRTTALATATILLFGTPLALFLSQRRQNILEALVTLPAVLPPAAAGLALLLALGRKGLVGGYLHAVGVDLPFTAGAVVIAQIYVAVPFFVRPTAAAFREISPDLQEAATLDGASPLSLFWRIALPLVRRPLAAALTLAWARALGEFGATILFAGNRPGETQTLPLAIYLGFETDIDVAAGLSVLLLAIAVGAIATTLLLQRRADA